MLLPAAKAYSWPENPPENPYEIWGATYYSSHPFFIDRTDADHEEKDMDGDMLTDVEEQSVAEYFRPFLSFENYPVEPARRPNEPLVLFQVQPETPEEILQGENPQGARCEWEGDYSTCRGIRIVYMMLWEIDGGEVGYGTHNHGTSYGTLPDCDCGIDHEADAQWVKVWLRSEDGGGSWKVEKAVNGPEVVNSGCFERDYGGLDKFQVFYDPESEDPVVVPPIISSSTTPQASTTSTFIRVASITPQVVTNANISTSCAARSASFWTTIRTARMSSCHR